MRHWFCCSFALCIRHLCGNFYYAVYSGMAVPGCLYSGAFSGCASDTEPSAATMAFLINKVQDENIKTVLKMELSNENIAKAIAEATNADVKEFYSCHNLTAKQFADGETYLSLMEKNVETLREVLN